MKQLSILGNWLPLRRLDCQMSIEGAIEYVRDSHIQGWVGWNGAPGSVVLRLSPVEEVAAVLTDRADAPGSQTFRCEVTGVTIDRIARGEVAVVARNGSSEKRLPLWRVLRLAYEVSGLTDAQLRALKFWTEQVGGVGVPVDSVGGSAPNGSFGAVSTDGDAVVGRNGHLFLGAGTNRVSELYTSEASDKSAQWLQLFSSRLSCLRNRGVNYLQLVLPEKSSALAELCPFPAACPSPAFKRLIGMVDESPIRSNVLCMLLKGEVESFLRNDSHLSTGGAKGVAATVLGSLGVRVPDVSGRIARRLVKGDLGSKFEGDHRDLIDVMEELVVGGHPATPQLVHSSDPVEGHKGIVRVWRNEASVFPERVVAFANSFFERGATSTQLSWWFARLFREFHFVWSPSLDLDYVDSVKPDHVICQTIERFLRVVPEA